MKKQIIALGAALSLVAAVGVGSTLAYLTSTTDAVVNTFTVGQVKISLDETVAEDGKAVTEYDYKNILPGDTLYKRPVVHVDEKSEACYLFVKVINTKADVLKIENLTEHGWTAYSNVAGVYYREVEKTGEKQDFAVFTDVVVDGDKVTESTDVNLGSIKIDAAAVQKQNLSLEEAYDQIADSLVTE